MDARSVTLAIRGRSGLGLRALARRAATSHATLHAYEAGTKDPRWATVTRLADAGGLSLDVVLRRRHPALADRAARGRELAEALDLAAQFPARPAPSLDAPVFGRRP